MLLLFFSFSFLLLFCYFLIVISSCLLLLFFSSSFHLFFSSSLVFSFLLVFISYFPLFSSSLFFSLLFSSSLLDLFFYSYLFLFFFSPPFLLPFFSFPLLLFFSPVFLQLPSISRRFWARGWRNGSTSSSHDAARSRGKRRLTTLISRLRNADRLIISRAFQRLLRLGIHLIRFESAFSRLRSGTGAPWIRKGVS